MDPPVTGVDDDTRTVMSTAHTHVSSATAGTTAVSRKMDVNAVPFHLVCTLYVRRYARMRTNIGKKQNES